MLLKKPLSCYMIKGITQKCSKEQGNEKQINLRKY